MRSADSIRAGNACESTPTAAVEKTFWMEFGKNFGEHWLDTLVSGRADSRATRRELGYQGL